ncbi:MAG: protoheme IX farnesyltransferase [Flavobacteriales bacterium]|nr:protoheme IX farnesyltransferase [Flavobacteriales bacterium]
MLSNYIELLKPRLSATVIFSCLAGYLLATPYLDFNLLVNLLIGGIAIVGASNGLNQVYEVEIDSLMDRTKNRPLPTKRISVNSALIFSLALALIGLFFLSKINFRCVFFAALSSLIYVVGYTPLKTTTPISGFIGAFPGAMPFMLGWVAVTNQFSLETGILFAIQFLWQFPHFWSIAWVRYEDYQKGGIQLLPSGYKDHKTAFQIVFYTFWLLPVSVAPLLLKYFSIDSRLELSLLGSVLIFVIGSGFLYQAFQLLKTKQNKDAKKLMIYSLIYLPLVQIIYIVDKYV